jgi:hypothetical protein
MPTTASIKYVAPFLLGTTGTITAIATAPDYINSPVALAGYSFIGSPSALSGPPTNVTTATATLNGLLNTGGLACTWSFEYGTSPTALSSSTTAAPLGPSGSPEQVSISVTGLTTKTKYYYKVTVTTAAGTSSGEMLSFTTN